MVPVIASNPSYASDTILRLYKPFSTNPTEKMTSAMQKVYKGQCGQQSQKISREDAWRCQYEDKVVDPCFIKAYGNHKEAFCPQSPWKGNGIPANNEDILIQLESPVESLKPLDLDFSTDFPWGLELVNGKKCLAVEPGRFFDNMPIRYRCNDQSELFGNLQRCKDMWSILQVNNGVVETVEIIKAWF
jgi:hypothetical protein